MKRGLSLLVLFAALTGCSGAGNSGDDAGKVSRTEMGKAWPLTVDSGTLSCEGSGGVGAVVFTAPNGTEYAVNGTAKGSDQYADIRPIWADDKSLGYGLKKDISPLIDKGLALCE